MNIIFKYTLNYLILFLGFLSIQSCEDKIENKEVEVTIIRAFSTGQSSQQGDSSNNDRYAKRANVRYTVKNMDTETITGWKIYFSVATDMGPRMNVGGRFACTLDPGELSSEKIASNIVSAGTGNAISATLNLIEAW